MATQTDYYGMTKPAYSDPADIAVINADMDIIDLALHGHDSDISSLDSSIADVYDTATSYTEGDYCIYDHILYVCTADTSGSFDSSCWSATTIDSVLGDLKNSVSDGKTTLADAITDKGVETASTDTFATMASNIASIPTYTTTESAEQLEITDAMAKPAMEVIVDIALTQSGSGTPSPDNVREILSYASAGIVSTSENLFDETDFEDGYFSASATVGEGYSINSSTTSVVYKECAYLKAGVTYTLSYTSAETPASTNVRKGVICDDDGIVLENNITTWRSDATSLAITPTYSGWLYITIDNLTTEPTLVIGSTAGTYSEHEGSVNVVDFGRTICSGTLNVTTGELTIEYGYVDLGGYTWRLATSEVYFYAVISDAEITALSTVGDAYCSAYEVTYGNAVVNGTSDKIIAMPNTDSYLVRLRDTDYTDATTLQSALSGVYFAYKLSESVTYQLTPAVVQMLLNQTIVYADCGDVTVTYRVV